MKHLMQIIVMMGIFTLMMSCGHQYQSRVDTKPMESVDLKRYMGRWYEIARYPNSFEQGLSRVRAHYTLLDNGRVRIQNTGYKADGEEESVVGEAYVPNATQAGHLRLSFIYPYRWFYSSYNILYVNVNYSLALVSGKGDDYLWILSRSPQISEAQKHDLLGIARARGFDTKRLYYPPSQ